MQNKQLVRSVDNHGEILIVRKYNGLNVLVDPIFRDVVVYVPTGRRAKLVEFDFGGITRSCGRDAQVTFFQDGFDGDIGFAYELQPKLRVFLQELAEGQRVDVSPVAAVYAALSLPLPVFYGSVAVQPVYACA